MTSLQRTGRVFLVLALFCLGVLVFVDSSTASPTLQEPQEQGAPAEQEHGEATDQEHAAEESHEAEPKAWFHWPAKWFNFIALSALLYWVLVIPPEPVKDIFSYSGLSVILPARASSILEARDVAVAQKDEAARIVADADQRLTKIDGEVAGLVSQARGDAEREQVKALEDGKKQAAKILEVAQREIANEQVGAHRQLRGFVADLAVNLAARSLSEHLTADDQDRLIREYLSRLGGSIA